MSGLGIAIALHTRIPITPDPAARSEIANSAPWFPIVGLGIGAVIAASYVSLSMLLPNFLAAVIATTLGAVLTGAFHEDGLGDVADAFAGGWSIERRLEILDDPRQGTFGVIALTASFLLRVGAIAALDVWSALALIPAAHALSRVGGIVLMRSQPLARPGGLAADFAMSLTRTQEVTGIVIGITSCAILIGLWTFSAVVLCAATVFGMAALARRKIGGINGDVLGATQQISELAILLVGATVVHRGWDVLAWWRS